LRAHHNGHEHELEPEYGLPERLPAGEDIVWQGSPSARELFFDVFHARALLAYFGLLLAWRFFSAVADSNSLPAATAATVWIMPIFALALAMFWALSVLMARTTVYTLTNRRVVMRVGIVLSLTFNIPWSRIVAADVRRQRTGSGDIAFRLVHEDKIAYPHLWPHARPWHLSAPQPMLRGLPQVDAVAALAHAAWIKAARSQENTRVSSHTNESAWRVSA